MPEIHVYILVLHVKCSKTNIEVKPVPRTTQVTGCCNKDIYLPSHADSRHASAEALESLVRAAMKDMPCVETTAHAAGATQDYVVVWCKTVHDDKFLQSLINTLNPPLGEAIYLIVGRSRGSGPAPNR